MIRKHLTVILGATVVLASVLSFAFARERAYNPGPKLAQCSIHYFVAANMAVARNDEEDKIYYGLLSDLALEQAEPYITDKTFGLIVKSESDTYTKLFESNPEDAVKYLTDSIKECDSFVGKKPPRKPDLLTAK